MDAVIIESEALKLPETERAILIDHLQESLSTSKTTYLDEHLEEAHDRYEAYQRGEISTVDGKEVVSELKKKLAK